MSWVWHFSKFCVNRLISIQKNLKFLISLRQNSVNCNQNDSRERLLSPVINRSRSPRRIGKSGRLSAARNGRWTLRTWWKSALSFLPVECSSIRRSRAVLFYPLSQFLPSPALLAGTATGGRRERFISTPVAIIPFVSQSASHGSRRRAFSLTFSLFTISPAPPRAAPMFSVHRPPPQQVRPLDESSAQRYLDISTGTLNTSRRRIYSPKRSSTLMNDAHRRASVCTLPGIFATSLDEVAANRKSGCHGPLSCGRHGKIWWKLSILIVKLMQDWSF